MSMNWAVTHPENMSKVRGDRAVVNVVLFFTSLARQFKLVSMIRFLCLLTFSTVPLLIVCTYALWVCRRNIEHSIFVEMGIIF